MHRQQLKLLLTTCYCRDTGGKGTLQAQRTNFNTLDNWGHKNPTQSKKRRDRKARNTIHSVTIILLLLLLLLFIIIVIILSIVTSVQRLLS